MQLTAGSDTSGRLDEVALNRYDKHSPSSRFPWYESRAMSHMDDGAKVGEVIQSLPPKKRFPALIIIAVVVLLLGGLYILKAKKVIHFGSGQAASGERVNQAKDGSALAGGDNSAAATSGGSAAAGGSASSVNGPAVVASGTTVNVTVVNLTVNPHFHNPTIIVAPDAAEAMKRMETIQKAQELSKKFPLGFQLFTLLGRREIVPLKAAVGTRLFVDWEDSAKLELQANGMLRLHLPSIGNPVTATFITKSWVDLEPKVGSRWGILNDGTVAIAAEVVAIVGDNIVVALGAKYPPRPVSATIKKASQPATP